MIKRRTVLLATPALILSGRSRAQMGCCFAAPGNSTSAEQFFDRLLTMPSAQNQVLYANLIDALVAAGVWSLLDALVICAALDAGTSLVNLVSSSFGATVNESAGVPTFSQYLGWTGDGANVNINTNFIPSMAGGNYSKNSAMVGCWSLTAAAEGNQSLWSSGSGVVLQPYVSPGNVVGYSNSSTGQSAANPGGATGFFVTNRTSANSWSLLRNNAVLGSFTDTAQTLVNSQVQMGTGLFLQFAAYCIGAGLSSSQLTALYSALTTYLTAVGAL